MIFHGRFGKATTSEAREIIRDYYVSSGLFQQDATFWDIRTGSRAAPGYEGLPLVMVVDAPIADDLEMIRDVVRNFLRSPPPENIKRFILFEEADLFSFDMQKSLHHLVEAHPNTISIYTINDLGKISPEIRRTAQRAAFEINNEH
jgi:hypothetical protein